MAGPKRSGASSHLSLPGAAAGPQPPHSSSSVQPGRPTSTCCRSFRLGRRLGLARAYFEAFGPQPGTPLEAVAPEDPLRAHRLVQASFLLRDYGFDLEDLAFDPRGGLPRHVDPKLAYAQAVLAGSPVEVNRAPREMLLRVPGIGPRTAEALLNARRQRSLRSLDQLHRLGVIAERAAPYITLDGQAPSQQLTLELEPSRSQ